MSPMSDRTRHRPAYSLVEVVIATLLVGILMVASLDTVGGSTKSWLVANQSLEAERLAHELMSEVLAQAYSDPDTTDDPDLEDFGPEAGETSTSTRIDFDDIDDYDDWTASPPVMPDGSAVAGATGWSRSVVVSKLRTKKVDDTHNNDGTSDDGARLITVTTTDPEGATTTLRAIRSRLGALEQSIGVEAEVVKSLSITLDAGGSGEVRACTGLINHGDVP